MDKNGQGTGLTDAQREALDALRGARRVVLTGHERPDGDCIGAQAALSRVLTALGKHVRILNPDPPEGQFDYLSRECDYGVDDGGALPEHDLVVLLDCSELSRTGALANRFAEADSLKLVVDHHVLPPEAWWDAAFHDVSAAATGLLVYRIAGALGVALDEVAARGVFTSLVTDTGWFKYSNTDAESFRVAGELVESGVHPADLFATIYQRRSEDHPRLVGRVLDRLHYHADGRLALVDLPLAADGRAMDLETDDVLDLLRSVETVEVVLLVREIEKGICKLSARSKTDYNVNELARGFGGGGHVKASGATIRGQREDVCARVVAAGVAGFDNSRSGKPSTSERQG
ncbi:MAG: bifunctional oligoribonuclease/PAP phosphatase NrnA [bacterium]|nr:bifunctional oligoribonuclease/PAP phosphatase NrnA [bacterium]